MEEVKVKIDENNERRLESSSEREPPRLLSEEADSSSSDGDSTATTTKDRHTQKTLVVYSGPTSMDRLQDKNSMYIDNMNYFLEHGISCFDDAPEEIDDSAEPVIVNYAFVLTQEVADYYTAPNGPLTKKMQECKGVEKHVEATNGEGSPFIKVVTRQDRCYDMESIRTVVTKMNVQALYDNLLFINCGLVGPKFGPGTPKLIPASQPATTKKQNSKQPKLVPYSHWSQLYTSRLTDSVRLVGHSINTHFHTFFPHVQSFLYALRTETVPILLSSGAIYDCGLTQEELGSNEEKRFELINRYEVGMSTQLLKRGYKIATAFVNRYGFGKSLVYDKDSIWGTEIDDTVSDIWYEDGIRNLTATMSKPNPIWWNTEEKAGLRSPDENTFDYHQWDILPWDYFLFFKVSRLVPEDVQAVMNYNAEELERSNVPVIANDPRKSPSEYWLRKSGVFVDPARNRFLDSVRVIAVVMCLGLFVLFARRKRIPLMILKRPLSPRSRMGHLRLKRKQSSHDHDT
ncbi:hypothetical protein ACHAXR_003475 [Thalassiosira sp. AJA248-18]